MHEVFSTSVCFLGEIPSSGIPKQKVGGGGGFSGGAVVKNQPANARDTGSSPGPGRSHMPQSN